MRPAERSEAAPTRSGLGCSVGARVPWTNTRRVGRMGRYSALNWDGACGVDTGGRARPGGTAETELC
jgi:hypothetical protein